MSVVNHIHVNGTRRRIEAEAGRSLLGVLRDDLDLTGVKYGCGAGQCGACTVLIDGEPTRSCVTEVGSVGDRAVTTIEGLAPSGGLHPLQAAFLEADALQCGYCTPGMIMSAAGLLAKSPDPSDEEIVRHMTGNLCRCGTYRRIVAAVRAAAETLRRGRGEEGGGA